MELNYTKTDWDGKTGLEVSDIILDTFETVLTDLSNLEAKSNQSIDANNFSVTASGSTLTFTVKNNAGQTVSIPSVTLTVPKKGKELDIEIADIENLNKNTTVCKYGNSFLIYYSALLWNLNDDNEKTTRVANQVLYPKVTINNTTYFKDNNVFIFDSYSTTSSGTKTGVITLTPDMLEEGELEITIDLVSANEDISLLLNSVTQSCPSFKLNVLNPTLEVQLDNNVLNGIRSATDTFDIKFNISGSITVNGTTPQITKYICYRDSTPTITVTSNSITNATYTSLKGEKTLTNGALLMWIYAEINGVRSNIVYLRMLCNNAVSYPIYATMLNDVSEIGSYDMTVSLYDNTEFNIYAYSDAEKTVNYLDIINSETKNIKLGVVINAGVITDLSNSRIFTEAGEHSYKIYTGSEPTSFSIPITVNSIGSSMGELTSLLVNLSAYGRSNDESSHAWEDGDYKITPVEFDWSGNGFINNAFVINSGASATLNVNPFLYSTFTASFKILSANNISDELFVSCGTENTGFFIYSNKAVFRVNGKGIETEFSLESVHEITFVKYGSNYGNIISIYIDGTSLQPVVYSGSTNITSEISFSCGNSEVSIYNIGIFSLALSFTNVLALYCFNQTNSDDIIAYVKNNNVFGTTNTSSIADYSLSITPENLPIGSKYLVINTYVDAATNSTKDATPWLTICNYPGDEADKYKSIGHLVGNILFCLKVDDKGTAHARNFCADKGVLMAQGTSSMAYPMKNFRICFLKPIDISCAYYNSNKSVSKWGDPDTGGDAEEGDFGFTTAIYYGVPEDFYITTKGSTPDTYTATPSNSSATLHNKPEDGLYSSAKYPIRSKNFNDSVESAEAKLFCLKADYAESSGSHNTGFARLVHDAMLSTNICDSSVEFSLYIPLLTVVNMAGSSPTYKKEIRTTIDGFPIYLFFKDKDSNYTYFGKYNFNNEKSSKDVFGFEKIHDYFNNSVVKSESENLKELFGITDTDYYELTHFKYGIKSNKYNTDYDVSLDYINPTECWEFSNNTFTVEDGTTNKVQNNIGAFQFPYTLDLQGNHLSYMPNPNSVWKNPFTVKDSEGNYAWLSLAWEYRYPGLDEGSTGDTYYTTATCPPYLLDSLYKWLYYHNYSLTLSYDKLDDFAANLHKYFNINYLLKYFVLTKWFGNVDLRIKNCMLSFYCDPYVENNDGIGTRKDVDGHTNGTTTNYPYAPMGHMRAFYIFYDNDTIMGVDNAGLLTQAWNIDEDAYPGYGMHGIWSNLEECLNYYINGYTDKTNMYNLGELIQKAYQAVRSVITDDKLTTYFETDQVDIFADAIHNVDAQVKYYFINKINSSADEFSASSLSKYQGNRRYHRKNWLTKRTNWFDARFKGGSYDKYSYRFKVGGVAAGATNNNGGTIKITSGIPKWRFFITNSTSTLKLNSTLLNNTGDSYNFNIGSSDFSISDFVILQSLYGCKELDLSKFDTNSYFADFDNGGLQLPYLEKFILNTTDSNKKYFSNSGWQKILSTGNTLIFPNLKELIILNTAIRTGDTSTVLTAIDLSKLTKLTTVNLEGTEVEVILPNGSNLTSLTLLKPQSLSVSNKTKLSSITIKDTTGLTSLYIGTNNNDTLYELLFTLLNSKVSSLTNWSITLGTKDTYHNITKAQAEQLVAIINAVNNETITKANITGFVYFPSSLYSDYDTYSTVYEKLATKTGLTLSSTISSNLVINLPKGTVSFDEGKEGYIKLDSGILLSADDWVYKVLDTNNEKVSGILVESDKTSINRFYFNIASEDANTSKTYYLLIGAYYGYTTNKTDDDIVWYKNDSGIIKIPIQYKAVSKLTIKASNSIVSNGETITLNLVSDSDHTKSEWIKNHITWKIDDTATTSIKYDSGTSYTYVNSKTEDFKISISGLGEVTSNTLTILYDKSLTTITENQKDKLGWIYKILYNRYTADWVNYKNVKISTLHNITLTSSDKDLLNVLDDTTTIPVDLTYLKYFSINTSDLKSFTIPSGLLFTNIEFPDKVEEVIWSPNIDSYYSFENIIFPEILKKAYINISTSTGTLDTLKLDFSNTSITKISNSSSLNDYEALVTISYNNTYNSTIDSNLFAFPTTLTTFGNYKDHTNWNLEDSDAMFGRIDISTLESGNYNYYTQLYKIPDIKNTINLGKLFTYRAKYDSNAFAQSTSLVTGLYKTFMYNSNLPIAGEDSTLSFGNIVEIGPKSFFYVGTKLKDDSSTFNSGKGLTINLGSTLKYIGDDAFFSFTGIITGTSSITKQDIEFIDLSNIEEIGARSFEYTYKPSTETSITRNIYLKNITKIGKNAFQNDENSNVSWNIYIDSSSGFEYDSTDGIGTGNTLYLTTATQKALGNIPVGESGYDESKLAAYNKLVQGNTVITIVES